MKIILSRKGFDSSSGGCPSPILPDGTLLSLPIPDSSSTICYKDITRAGLNLGQLVSDITNGIMTGRDNAHLDPDIDPECYSRSSGWLPVFGQKGSAQGHLRNQGVGAGDIFLFYGLFREVEKQGGIYVWRRTARTLHIIWGWLQVDCVIKADPQALMNHPWLSYHPHFRYSEAPNNVIYLSRPRLSLPGVKNMQRAGSATMSKIQEKLVLSAPDSGKRAGLWELPQWCFPRNNSFPLTYHHRKSRWYRKQGTTQLDVVGRGQEFILDTNQYPEAIDWAKSIVGCQ